MEEIHKIAGIAIKDNAFLMVRKVGKDIWTSLGGKPEGNESEKETLLREIEGEIHCSAEIIKKIGDFKTKAVFDDAILRLSVYLVELKGEVRLDDPELEECRFIPKNYKELGIKLPDSVENHIVSALVKEGVLKG